MYTFTLKVMDTSNQSSEAVVHVFVKPPTSNPPVGEYKNAQTCVIVPLVFILHA